MNETTLWATEAPFHGADLAPVANHWQRAFDADYRALTAVEGILPAVEVGPRLRALARERHDAGLLLCRLAQATRAKLPPALTALLDGPVVIAGFPQRDSG